MEIRARYVLVGLFSLAIIVAGFGFVYWLNNVGGLSERTSYRIRFENSVSGLLLGSAVQFNGIRVGEVTGLKLNPQDPRQVVVTITVAADTPVRSDTKVGLVFGGLTGVPEVALTGGTPGASLPEAADGGPPLLVAATSSTQDWTEAAREAFTRIDQLLADDSEALKNTLANLETFSDALARNSDSVDTIIAGLERLTGGGKGSTGAAIYELVAPDISVANIPDGQLVVNLPTAPLAYDTQKFLVESDGSETTAFENAEWSDGVPKVVQSSVIRSFENAGFSRIGSDLEGLVADYTLLLDIRSFHISKDPKPHAEVDFFAKVMSASGEIVAARRFQETASSAAMQAETAAAALNQAFDKAVEKLVPWTLAALRSPAPAQQQ
jgi:phospholipid/cholesterol/gamma-HCH transport system substrate-binding protein